MATENTYRVHGSGGVVIEAHNDVLAAGTKVITYKLNKVYYAIASVKGGTANAIAVDTSTAGQVTLTGTGTDEFDLVLFGN